MLETVTYELVIVRPGFHDDGSDLVNTKPFKYEKSAIDAHAKAKFNHERLASSIVLYRINHIELTPADVENGVVGGDDLRTPIREWYKDAHNLPNYLYSFIELDATEVSALEAQMPYLADEDGVLQCNTATFVPESDDEGEVISPAQRALAMMDDCQLLDIKDPNRVPAIILPNWDSSMTDSGEGAVEIALCILSAFKERYGRLPFIVRGHSVYGYNPFKLVDLQNEL